MNHNNKILKKFKEFIDNPISVLFVVMITLVEITIQTRILTNIGETLLLGYVMLFIMILVFPNVSWTKPYFTLPWKEYAITNTSQKESTK